MDTSNHSWNAGDRPSLRVTPSGIQLLAYLDYVNVRQFVSLAPTDTVGPEAPPERYDDDHQDPPQPRPNPRKTPHPDQPEYQYDEDDPDAPDEGPGNPGFEDDWDLDNDDYGDHSPEED